MTSSSFAGALDRIGQVQAHLSGPASIGIAIAAIAAVALPWAWLVARHLTVMAHEAAHAALASGFGYKIKGIEFKPNADGATHTSGPSGGVGGFAIAFIGYLGPSAFGLGAAALISVGHIVAVLWLGLVALLAILVRLRWGFGVLTVVLAFAALLLVAVFGPVGMQVVTAYALTWFLLVSSVRIIGIRGTRASDAGKLRDMTHVPAGFWWGVWLLASLAALAFGATLLV